MLEAVEGDSGDERHERDAARWLAFLEELLPDLMSSRRAMAFERFDEAYDHLHDALPRLVQRADADRAARMVHVLREFWGARGRAAEGRQWVARILALPGAAAPGAARARLLDHGALLAGHTGDVATARAQLEECLAIRRALGLATSLPVTLAHLATAIRAAGGDDATAVL